MSARALFEPARAPLNAGHRVNPLESPARPTKEEEIADRVRRPSFSSRAVEAGPPNHGAIFYAARL